MKLGKSGVTNLLGCGNGDTNPLNILIQNTALTATLTLLNLEIPVPRRRTFQVIVASSNGIAGVTGKREKEEKKACN